MPRKNVKRTLSEANEDGDTAVTSKKKKEESEKSKSEEENDKSQEKEEVATSENESDTEMGSNGNEDANDESIGMHVRNSGRRRKQKSSILDDNLGMVTGDEADQV